MPLALQAEGISRIFVTGIATDVCVSYTVKDALLNTTGEDLYSGIQLREKSGFGLSVENADELLVLCSPCYCSETTHG